MSASVQSLRSGSNRAAALCFLLLGSWLGAAEVAAQELSPPPPTPPAPVAESPHALAARARWMTLPSWALSSFLDANTELNDGWSVGLEYLYRRSGFDVVLSVDYSWLSARSGNFLGKGHDPSTDTHLVVFDRLSSLSADVSLIGHWNLTSWMELRFGAGLGVGYVFGSIYQITSNSGCTVGNAGDTSHCYPTPVGPINQVDDSTRQNLESHRCTADFSDNGLDTPGSPCYRRIDTFPMSVRVVPVLNVLLGMRFRASRHVYFHLDGGWRLASFYLGAGPEFRL